MINEKQQVLDGLSLINEMFSNLQVLVFNLDKKIRNGEPVPNIPDIIDALNKSLSTLRLALEYVSNNTSSSEIKNSLSFYREWIAYLNRTLNAIRDNNLVSVVFGIVSDIIIDLYKSFREFKKQIEEPNNTNSSIPTREL